MKKGSETVYLVMTRTPGEEEEPWIAFKNVKNALEFAEDGETIYEAFPQAIGKKETRLSENL